jgi:hypothetical protein
MVKAGRTIGRFLRNVVTSPNWRTLQQASREIRTLPNRLMREAGLEEIQADIKEFKEFPKEIGLNEMKKEINKISGDISDWVTPLGENISPSDIIQTAEPSNESSKNDDVIRDETS